MVFEFSEIIEDLVTALAPRLKHSFIVHTAHVTLHATNSYNFLVADAAVPLHPVMNLVNMQF